MDLLLQERDGGIRVVQLREEEPLGERAHGGDRVVEIHWRPDNEYVGVLRLLQ